MTQEALKQMNLALETMEAAGKRIDELKAENKALKEALAQPQEPIYQYQMANGSWIDQTKESHDYNVRYGQATVRVVYTAPPQPEQEPVAWLHNSIRGNVISHRPADIDRNPDRWIALYTTPPQRPRVVFPTMLRKMWSGGEVQAWLDENVNHG